MPVPGAGWPHQSSLSVLSPGAVGAGDSPAGGCRVSSSPRRGWDRPSGRRCATRAQDSALAFLFKFPSFLFLFLLLRENTSDLLTTPHFPLPFCVFTLPFPLGSPSYFLLLAHGNLFSLDHQVCWFFSMSITAVQHPVEGEQK